MEDFLSAIARHPWAFAYLSLMVIVTAAVLGEAINGRR